MNQEIPNTVPQSSRSWSYLYDYKADISCPDEFKILQIMCVEFRDDQVLLFVHFLQPAMRYAWVPRKQVKFTPRLRAQFHRQKQNAMARKLEDERKRQQAVEKLKQKRSEEPAVEQAMPSTSAQIRQLRPTMSFAEYHQQQLLLEQQRQQQAQLKPQEIHPVGYLLKRPQQDHLISALASGSKQGLSGTSDQVAASTSSSETASRQQSDLQVETAVLLSNVLVKKTFHTDFVPQGYQTSQPVVSASTCEANVRQNPTSSSKSVQQAITPVTAIVQPRQPIDPWILENEAGLSMQSVPAKENRPPPAVLETNLLDHAEPKQKSLTSPSFAMPLTQLAAALVSPPEVYQQLYGKREGPSPVLENRKESVEEEDDDVVFLEVTGPTPRKQPKVKVELKPEQIGTEVGSFTSDEVLCLSEGTKADLGAMDWDAFFLGEGHLRPKIKSEGLSDHSAEPRPEAPSLDTMWLETSMPLEGKVDNSIASNSSDVPPMLSPGTCMITESGRAWSPAEKEDKEEMAHLEGLARDC